MPTDLPPWTDFVPGTLPEITPDLLRTTAEGFGITEAEARAALEWNAEGEVWLNSRYQVNARWSDLSVDTGGGSAQHGKMVHLSIKRRDKQPPGPERWRDFQRIKNELVGPEFEAVEMYPAESRVVDTANQYHLWVVAISGFRFPFGFQTQGEPVIFSDSRGGAVQRPFEED